QYPLSTRTTLAPRDAAPIAAHVPAGPPPMISTSVSNDSSCRGIILLLICSSSLVRFMYDLSVIAVSPVQQLPLEQPHERIQQLADDGEDDDPDKNHFRRPVLLRGIDQKADAACRT